MTISEDSTSERVYKSVAMIGAFLAGQHDTALSIGEGKAAKLQQEGLEE